MASNARGYWRVEGDKDFLHRYWYICQETQALEMSKSTMIAMASGGMNDQLGGGFHRYCVDERWIVSHFEKMLYDQAQLAITSLELWQITKDPLFADTTRKTLDYVLQDLWHEDEAGFAAEDADSLPYEGATHKEEGAYYVWTRNEIETLLGAAEAAVFNDYRGVESAGNAPEGSDPSGEFKGKNILLARGNVQELSRRFDTSVQDIQARIASADKLLLAKRAERPKPHRDEKVITGWNGLMTSALARAGSVLNEPHYTQAAKQVAQFISSNLYVGETKTLLRHWKDGPANVEAFAEDYAFLVRGLLDLYEAEFDIKILIWAQEVNVTLYERFWDSQAGGYFSSSPDPNLILRFKDDYDGAEPSTNSVAFENHLRLWHLFNDKDEEEKCMGIETAFAGRVDSIPASMPFLLGTRIAMDNAPTHIVIVGEKESPATQELLNIVHTHYIPFKSLVMIHDEESHNYFAEKVPFMAGMRMEDSLPTAFVCSNFSCNQPTNNPRILSGLLDKLTKALVKEKIERK